ncbi:hypothetical protein DL96DRAFT_1490851 [Flagelloscypha sp. PMI_526]|nr:hypothetical protein DL96DRAFT_1490851 [Flagelloscypha sp. PMI_526]
MAAFLISDELGGIKRLSSTNYSLQTLLQAPVNPYPVQALALNGAHVATGSANGSLSVYNLPDNDELIVSPVCGLTPRPFKSTHRFVGMAVTESSVLSCSNAGVLSHSNIDSSPDAPIQPNIGHVPIRLTDWKLSTDGQFFICGGDEVSPSVWSVEDVLASQGPSTTGKRKRKDDLEAGEVWRAKNVPNDSLGLRQPIRINSLDFVSPSVSNRHNIVVGTQLGDVRRYDTRTSKKEVSRWQNVCANGVKLVKTGVAENQLFVADATNGLSSIDMRTGRVMYTYRGGQHVHPWVSRLIRCPGIAGAVTSMATSSDPNSSLATTCLDRYARIHSAPPPPERASDQQPARGDTKEKVYTKALPTCIIFERIIHTEPQAEAENDIWDELQAVEDNNKQRSQKK